jgi:arylsulfatase A-like enzyme
MKHLPALVLLIFALPLLAGKPHMLLIVSDDQGYNDLGCLNPEIITPHLDRLAREGVRLSNFYVSWPACTPSRGSLLTGRYPQRNGIYDMIRNEAPDYGHRYTPEEYAVSFERIGGMDERELLLPGLLQPAGYTSGIFGKWDLGALKRYLPTRRGFDTFYGFVNTGIDYFTHERYGVHCMVRDLEPTREDVGTYCTYLFEREALRFLDQHHAKPFFLYVPFNAPHGSSSLDPRIRGTVQVPEKFQRMYPPVEEAFRDGARYGKAATVPTKAKRQRDYRAALTCMDASIGSLLKALDDKGIADDTVVIFFSDNGGGGGADNRPLRGGKGKTWEGGVRVPCIIRWPSQLPKGVVNDAFLTSLEIVPTLLRAAGARVPPGLVLDGFDMLPVLQGKAVPTRAEMFWKRKDFLGARVGNWKWVEMGEKGGLFDLSKDPGEDKDLSETHPEVLARVKAAFHAWLSEMNSAEPRGPFKDY